MTYSENGFRYMGSNFWPNVTNLFENQLLVHLHDDETPSLRTEPKVGFRTVWKSHVHDDEKFGSTKSGSACIWATWLSPPNHWTGPKVGPLRIISVRALYFSIESYLGDYPGDWLHLGSQSLPYEEARYFMQIIKWWNYIFREFLLEFEQKKEHPAPSHFGDEVCLGRFWMRFLQWAISPISRRRYCYHTIVVIYGLGSFKWFS